MHAFMHASDSMCANGASSAPCTRVSAELLWRVPPLPHVLSRPTHLLQDTRDLVGVHPQGQSALGGLHGVDGGLAPTPDVWCPSRCTRRLGYRRCSSTPQLAGIVRWSRSRLLARRKDPLALDPAPDAGLLQAVSNTQAPLCCLLRMCVHAAYKDVLRLCTLHILLRLAMSLPGRDGALLMSWRHCRGRRL